jgi:hypothetical protein
MTCNEFSRSLKGSVLMARFSVKLADGVLLVGNALEPPLERDLVRTHRPTGDARGLRYLLHQIAFVELLGELGRPQMLSIIDHIRAGKLVWLLTKRQ